MSTPDPSDKKYHCIIIGGGHNGLVCAAYLARADKSVLVLELAAELGGAARNREFAAGFKVSAGAHLLHALPSDLIRDLNSDEDPWGDVLVYSFYTPYDWIVVPASTAILRNSVDGASSTPFSFVISWAGG